MRGVGGRGMPMFAAIELFASGKRSLKTFSQMRLCDQKPLGFGRFLYNRYSLLYLNEVLVRLLVDENPSPDLWQSYRDSVIALRAASDTQSTRRVLRRFESVLFAELGASVDWFCDGFGAPLKKDAFYRFSPSEGFALAQKKDNDGYAAAALLDIGQGLKNADFFDRASEQTLLDIGQIYRARVDFLLDYKPLNSRKLWAEQQKRQQERL